MLLLDTFKNINQQWEHLNHIRCMFFDIRILLLLGHCKY